MHEAGTGSDLLAQPQGAVVLWRREWIGGRADEEARGRRDRPAVIQDTLFTQVVHHADQMDGIYVINILGFGMITPDAMIAAKAEQVADAQGGRAQQIGLDRQAVAIATSHLGDRFDAMTHEQRCHRDAGHPHAGRLIVGDINGIGVIFEQRRIVGDAGQIHPLGGREFGRDGKAAGFKHGGQMTDGSRHVRVPRGWLDGWLLRRLHRVTSGSR